MNGKDIKNDLKEAIRENNSPLHMAANFAPGMQDILISRAIELSKNLTLLLLYFNKYPYLFNLLSFEEVKKLFKVKLNVFTVQERQNDLLEILEEFCEKIKANESILDDIENLKEIQISLIYLITYTLSVQKKDPSIFINHYQIINFFRDIDFCLKIYLTLSYASINNKKHNLIDEFIFALTICEPKYPLYVAYLLPDNKGDKFTEEEQKIINDALTIKDFIIIGDNQFHEKMKLIEKNIKSNSFKYLNEEQISKYLDEKKKEKGKIMSYFYFLIVDFEGYQKNIGKISKLSFETGITFLVFIYIENENNIKFNKNQLNLLMATILVYSPEDIISYLSQKLNFISSANLPSIEEIGKNINITIPKISFEQNEEDIYQVDVSN